MTAYKEYDFPSVDGPIRIHVTRRIRDEEMHMEAYGEVPAWLAKQPCGWNGQGDGYGT